MPERPPTSAPGAPWPGDWLRGVLEIAVLRCLADTDESYGYAISVALEERGFGQVKGGTLYPLLSRLDDAGHVTTQWRPGDGGPGRKYYTITERGTAYLREATTQWCAFADTMTTLLRPSDGNSPRTP